MFSYLDWILDTARSIKDTPQTEPIGSQTSPGDGQSGPNGTPSDQYDPDTNRGIDPLYYLLIIPIVCIICAIGYVIVNAYRRRRRLV